MFHQRGHVVNKAAAHERLRCIAPEGTGAVDVVVDVNGQCASASTPLEYAPPRLRDATYELPTVGGALILHGANLGAPHLGVRLQVVSAAPRLHVRSDGARVGVGQRH